MSNVHLDKFKDEKELYNIITMFSYLGVQEDDLMMVYDKFYFWDFVKSLVDGFVKYGYRLTDKQREAITKHIYKQFPDIKLKHTNVFKSDTKYKSSNTGSTVGKQVIHNYGSLEPIDLYDLPYEEGEELGLIVFGYNKHSLVLISSAGKYKIPKPTKFPIDLRVGDSIKITCTYHRTACKGYLLNIQMVANASG